MANSDIAGKLHESVAQDEETYTPVAIAGETDKAIIG
jgi:hypothetical protein